MANKQHTELLISHIFTAMEMAKAAGWDEHRWMEHIIGIGLLTRPDKPSA
jgi:hypothetical protein